MFKHASKPFLLVLALVVSFSIGFGAAVKADEPIPGKSKPAFSDRNRWHGYFKNKKDDVGDAVLPAGVPNSINTDDEFIAYIKANLNSTDDQKEIGAAFIIDTMISDGAPTSYVRTYKPTAAQIADWESRVRAANIDWFVDDYEYYTNTYYQDDVAAPGDVAYYYEHKFTRAITFKNSAGQVVYIIKRDCANPLGALKGLPKAASYNLLPSVTPSSNTAQQGDSITFTYRINNTGTTAAPNVACVRDVPPSRPAGYTPLPQQDTTRPNTTALPGCPVTIPPKTVRTLPTETVVIGNQAPGTKVCRSLVINPKSQAGGFRASAEVCVTIAKSPLTHFMGNDVWAGGNFPDIAASCTGNSKIETIARQLPDGSLAGSVSEYGAFALGPMSGFGTASKPHIAPAATIGKAFSFANTGATPGNYGAGSHCINDYLARFSSNGVTTLPGSIDVGARGTGVWRVNGNFTMHGTVPNGARQVYIIQNGSVTVDGDIKYSGNYNSLADIPSLVVITTCTTPSQCANPANANGHIKVNDNVAQMDGLFIAKNTFNTCANRPDPLSVSACNAQLTVNGAVIANQLVLRRTHGSDGVGASRKTPAEIFNFTTEMYLRSALQQNSGATVETVDVRELPPRF